MKIIEDSNAEIRKAKNGKFEIIDITTKKKHADCEKEFFNSYEQAYRYMEKTL